MSLFDRDPIIADRAEFAEALQRLRAGHILVRTGCGACSCVLDGAFVHHSFETLLEYELIESFDNRCGFPGVEYYRISARGREFGSRVWAQWRSRPVLERLVMRMTG